MDYFAQFLTDFPAAGAVYTVLQVIGIILDVLLVSIFILSFYQLIQYRPRIVLNPKKWQRYVKKKKEPKLSTPVIGVAWNKVQAKLKDGSPDSLRLAIVEADGMVDEVLKRMGLGGDTFADRLGHLPQGRYATAEKIWDAHRVRNNIVHTPDFSIPEAQAQEVIGSYEAFLKEVKAL